MMRKNQAILPEETAAQMLENIFRSCKKTPNTVPLSTLRQYSNYRKERFALQRTVILVILTLFALLPLLFITGNFSITAEYTQGTMKPRYHVTPSSLLPVRQMSVLINGSAQPVCEGENGTYIIQPTQEGLMEIRLTLINQQKTVKTIQVSGVDYTLPQLIDHQKSGNAQLLYFSDEGSGINGTGISVTDEAGEAVSHQFDTDENCLIFPVTKGNLYIVVPDQCGNVLEFPLIIQ